MKTRRRAKDGARTIGFLIYPGFQSLDLSGPLEVFACATGLGRERAERGRGAAPVYRTSIHAATPGAVAAFSGLTVVADAPLRAPRLDTLFVVGGPGVAFAAADEAVLRFVRRTAASARRVASVCTGAFVLGAAGLLDGRRATTHWEYASALARLVPHADVDVDAIYTADRGIYTSAGITAGIDLALALVEQDGGRELALAVARYLVVPLHRAGGQSQFSVQLRAQVATQDPIRKVQSYVRDNVGADLSVSVLARRAGMSARNFARVFVTDVGTTPAAFVEATRVDVARRLLEQTGQSVEEVARGAGFTSAEVLRRAFARATSLSPLEYRRRFAAHGATARQGR